MTRLAFGFLALALMLFGADVRAQQMILPSNTGVIGMLAANGNTPVGTGCSVPGGATDFAGSCTATATSGSLVFAKTNLVNAPFCLLVDGSASAALPIYTVTATQITLTTIVSTHIYRWMCVEQAGM